MLAWAGVPKTSCRKKIDIYRGCDKKEHEDEEYRQAWTLLPDVATKFAYTHYLGRSWFHSENRVILKSSIAKEDVFFYSESHEGEVVG